MIDLSCIHENLDYFEAAEIYACVKCGEELTEEEVYQAWLDLQEPMEYGDYSDPVELP